MALTQDQKEANAKAVFNRVINAGYPAHVGHAMAGNIEGESGFDPSLKQNVNAKAKDKAGNYIRDSKGRPIDLVKNGKHVVLKGAGKGRGLYQHEVEGRFDTDPLNLVDFAKKRGKPWDDLETQVDFALEELKTLDRFKPTHEALINSKSTEEAVKALMHGYEQPRSTRPGHEDELPKEFNKRLQAANRWGKVLTPEVTPAQEPQLQSQIPSIPAELPNRPEAPEPQLQSQIPSIPNDYFQAQEPQLQSEIPSIPNDYFQSNEEYQPTAEDFAHLTTQDEYQPSAADFTHLTSAPQQAQPEQPSNILNDVTESVLGIPGAAIEGALNIPEHISAGTAYGREHPFKSFGQVGLGAAEFFPKMLSAPQVGARYIGSKVAPQSRLTQSLQRTATPFELMRQGEQPLGIAPSGERGESEMRGLGEMAVGGAGMKALESALKRMGMITSEQTGGGGDPIHAAVMSMAGEGFGKMGSRALDNRRGKNLPEEEVLQREVAERQASVKDAERATARAQDLNQKINELDTQLASTTDPRTMLPDMRFEGRHQNLQNIFDQTEQARSAAHEAQGQQLGRGQDFETRAAPEVIRHVENVKSEISPRYEAINDAARDVTIDIVNNARAQEIQAQMDELVNQGFANPMNDQIYDSILQQLEEQWPGTAMESIPAPQYINTYKATRDLARIARQRSRQEGLQQPERQRWEAQANQLEPLVRNQRGILQRELPDNLFNELLETDRLWGENVIPFYRNKIYQDARQHGRAPLNMIDKTAGNAPHQTIMQRAIQNNPELNRLAISQEYADRPHELMKPDERVAPYIESHTPTRNLLEAQRRATETRDRVQQQLDALEPQRQFRATQQEGVVKETTQQIKQREKMASDIKSMTQELEDIRKNTKSLDEEIKKRGISEDKLRRKQAYNKREREIKNKALGMFFKYGSAMVALAYGKDLLRLLFR